MRLQESDSGILIAQPTLGSGYQIAGAIQRLGRRMIGLLKAAGETTTIKEIPMQTFVLDWESQYITPGTFATAVTAPFTAAVLSLEPELSHGQIPQPERLERLRALAAGVIQKQPEIQIIVAVPEGTPLDFCESFVKDFPTSTLFLSPVTFGFRDAGLLDRSLELFRHRPGLLLKKNQSQGAQFEKLRLAYVGDLAALVVSAITAQKPQTLAGKILQVPTNLIGLKTFQDHFNRSFQPQAPFLEKLASNLSNEGVADALPTDGLIEKPAQVPSAHDFFPTLTSPPDRIFDQLARLSQREPFLDLVFPPSRSL